MLEDDVKMIDYTISESLHTVGEVDAWNRIKKALSGSVQNSMDSISFVKKVSGIDDMTKNADNILSSLILEAGKIAQNTIDNNISDAICIHKKVCEFYTKASLFDEGDFVQQARGEM